MNSLLAEVRVPDDLEKSHWITQFREHLSKLNQPEKDAMLDFVVACNILRNKEFEIKQISRGMAWRQDQLNKDRREILSTIGETFFCENAACPIPLSNQILREDLSRKLSKIDSINDNDLSDLYDLLWQARCDHRVWKSGLNEAYMNFVASKPSPNLTAVLLSIM